MLSVINANYKDDYKIALRFNDNREGEVDLRDFICNGKIKVFRQLEDMNKFKNFKVDYTLIWNDELDIAPEFLYFKAFEKDKTLQPMFQKWGYVS